MSLSIIALVLSALAVGCLVRWASLDAARARAGQFEALGRSMVEKGSAYVGLSASDGRAIGVDPTRGTIILGFIAPDGIRTAEYPLEDVRETGWSIEGYTFNETVGFVGFSQAAQIRAANREAALRARAASGLRIDLADVDRPGVLINLDADEGRLRRWTEILEQAFEGSLPVPPRPVRI